jgi:hypothetical protein
MLDVVLLACLFLPHFGFDRTVYVNTKKRKGKWWHELIHEREKDIQTEMM